MEKKIYEYNTPYDNSDLKSIYHGDNSNKINIEKYLENTEDLKSVEKKLLHNKNVDEVT